MANNFGIFYDLSQDLILNEAIKPIKTLALLYEIPKHFIPEFLKLDSPYIRYAFINAENLCIKGNEFKKKEINVIKEVDASLKIRTKGDIVKAVNFIGTQIYIFLSKKRNYSEPIFIRNLVFTSQGTINLKKTIFKILRSENLSCEEKFEIACSHFIGMKLIRNYFNVLPEEVINDYLEEVPIVKEHIPVYFWICRLTGRAKKVKAWPDIEFSDFNIEEEFLNGNRRVENLIHIIEVEFSNENINKTTLYLFYSAVYTYNDMAIQYLWDEFISHLHNRREILKRAYGNVHLCFRMANSIMYLLSKISIQEISYIFNGREEDITRYFLLQLRWQSSFCKLYDVFHHYFDEQTHINMITFVVSKICSNNKDEIDSLVLQEVLTKMSESYKYEMNSNYNNLFYNMLQRLYDKNYFEYCLLLLKINGPLNARKVFSTNLKAILFDLPVRFLRYDFIDDILDSSINSSQTIKELKTKFYNNNAREICRNYISSGCWDALKLFKNWCSSYVPKEQISILISDILFTDDGHFIKQLIFMNKNTDCPFKYANELLESCFETLDLISNFKRCIIMVKCKTEASKLNVYTEIVDCVQNFEFIFLQSLFNWKPCSNEEISKIKISLLNDNKLQQIIFRERNVLRYFSRFLFLM